MFVNDSSGEVFSEAEKDDIVQSVRDAEMDSSCEFKVHIDKACSGDSDARAKQLFEELGVNNTTARNGILFYFVLECRRFVILPDIGVEKVIENGFWNEIHNIMLMHFRKEEYVAGLSEAIKLTGEKLKNYFPSGASTNNEVPDDISME